MNALDVVEWSGAVLAAFTTLAIVVLASWFFVEMVVDARRERWARDAAALDEATAAEMASGGAS